MSPPGCIEHGQFIFYSRNVADIVPRAVLTILYLKALRPYVLWKSEFCQILESKYIAYAIYCIYCITPSAGSQEAPAIKLINIDASHQME